MTDEPFDASRPTIIAHRGFAGISPENTVRAARRATTGPVAASAIEVDVMPTGDGTVVCFHDSHLHATDSSRGLTDANGTVWETPDETVLAAEVLESGQTVPRLVDFLDAIPETVTVNVELKNPGTEDLRAGEIPSEDQRVARRDVWEPFVSEVVGITERYGNDVLFSSFCEGALAATRDVAPSIPVGVLTWDSPEDCLAIADRYDAEAIHPPWNLIRDTPFVSAVGHLDERPAVTSDVVAKAREDGRAVNVWTVETWYQAEQLRRVGVDGLIANYPFLRCSGDGHVDSNESPPTG